MTSISGGVPVFVIARDQLTWLLNTVEWIRKLDHISEIVILDNNSSYPPLLDWYSQTDCIVHRFSENLGKKVLWLKDMVPDKHFVLTDPDLEPISDIADVIVKFHSVMDRHKDFDKVGSSLKFDDVENQEVVDWESKFWNLEVEKDVYKANLDTTFAFYRPNTPYSIHKSLRVAGKYTLRHLPWYSDKPDDYYYYRDNIDTRYTHWTRKDLNTKDLE